MISGVYLTIVYFYLQDEQKAKMAIMHFFSALQRPAISEKLPKTLEEALHKASIREKFLGKKVSGADLAQQISQTT